MASFATCWEPISSTRGLGAGVFAFTSMQSVTFEAGATTTGSNSFYYCNNLNSVTLPDSVTSIGVQSFARSGLPSITLPSSVTSIGSNAFFYCFSLSSITMPSSTTSIGSGAFAYCTSLATINCLATTAPTLGATAFSNTSATQIHVPVGATGYGTTYGSLTVVADL